MHSIVEVWNEFVKELSAEKLFAEVRAYPLNRATNAQFLNDLGAVKMPCCLICYRGRTDEINVQAHDRNSDWAAIIADRDEKGVAWESVAELVDKFADVVLDKTFLDGNVRINGGHTVDVEASGIRFCIMTVLFGTRQQQLRKGVTS